MARAQGRGEITDPEQHPPAREDGGENRDETQPFMWKHQGQPASRDRRQHRLLESVPVVTQIDLEAPALRCPRPVDGIGGEEPAVGCGTDTRQQAAPRQGYPARGLERFQEKCVAVFRPEPRQNKELEHFCDSTERENALAEPDRSIVAPRRRQSRELSVYGTNSRRHGDRHAHAGGYDRLPAQHGGLPARPAAYRDTGAGRRARRLLRSQPDFAILVTPA
jgi:hypothetical protein